MNSVLLVEMFLICLSLSPQLALAQVKGPVGPVVQSFSCKGLDHDGAHRGVGLTIAGELNLQLPPQPLDGGLITQYHYNVTKVNIQTKEVVQRDAVGTNAGSFTLNFIKRDGSGELDGLLDIFDTDIKMDLYAARLFFYGDEEDIDYICLLK